MSIRIPAIKQIPVVDLGGLRTGAPEMVLSIADAIAAASRSIGFFYIVNHGVPAGLRQQVFEQSVALFALSAAEKSVMDIKHSRHMRGYFSYGGDKSDGINDDIKEGFDLALDLPLTDPYVQARLPFYGPNTWPNMLPAFKPVLNTYYDRLIDLGGALLRAFSIGLGVDEDYFVERFKKPIAQIRLLRYPPPIDGQEAQIGAGEHTDFGWITMIMQDDTGGLEVKNVDGEWIAVPNIPDSFVVNIGDLMQRWTNDEYPATWHRVTNRNNRARYATAFFMDPDFHVNVECLPSCTSPSRPARYAPVVVGDYMDLRFLETTTFRENEPAI